MRVETIKSINTNNTIKVTRDNEEELITIEFNCYMDKNITSIFELPEWAKCQDESFLGDAQAKLLPGNPDKRDRAVQTGVIVKLTEYKTLHLSATSSSTYKGTVKYESTPSEERGIILNGIRVHCLTPGTNEDFATMLSIVRNHEGGLIASTTLDSKYKKTFNFSTTPLCNEEYEITTNQFAHTKDNFLSILKGRFIGSWIYLIVYGKKYVTILKEGSISYRDIKANINGKDKLCQIISFSLEEV